ncbi:serine/threonine-protein kinase [Microbacterium sp.]|uniref:serine/threonine-protein kinase n=1 Tax=Microbacterium sp. TaxID=51671 RepID=UPI00333F270B
MSRRPSPPPELPGFHYVEALGAGGFADVFLYEQQMPRRRVAVKVLLADRVTSSAAQEFTDEANVMAMLSTHPAIVTIYQAGVAADGRPYLVMEYCPRPNLQARSRKEAFPVAEALRVGIQVSGAVETAHRAGVLHRDIKPANILVTEYNRPALTDFGIASTTGALTEAAGMSIPWSPPESFGDPPTSGPRTDVYALGATVYTLLAGRSPFERAGERNTSADLIERIERAPLPALTRPDVPQSLQQTLARAMAKNPADRYPSAVAFGRALQKVQIELSHSVTPIDIVDEHPAEDEIEDDGDGLTRVREVVSIDPTRPSATTEPRSVAPSIAPAAVPPGTPSFVSPPRNDPAEERTQRRVPTSIPPAASAPAVPVPSAPATAGAGDGDRTVLRGPVVVAPDAAAPVAEPAPEAAEPVAEPPASRSRRGLWIGLAVGIAALIVVGVIVVVNLVSGGPAPKPSPSASADPKDPVSAVVPQVTDLAGTRSGDTVTFTWKNPDPKDGDSYIWAEITLDGSSRAANIETETVTLDANPDGQTCIDVSLRRAAGGRSSDPLRGCVK